MEDLIGTVVLERYRIDAVLGRGAMGAVYRGTHLRLDRGVAIKVMHEHLTDQTLLQRFRREAKVAAKLAHPNLIGVLDAGETDDGRPVMVLELAAGKTLTDILEIHPAPRRVIRLVKQILLGLGYAHEAGLIHRDLKPDNIMVEIGEDGTEIPRIVDFGIALLRDGDGSVEGGRLTETGQVLGTPLYMAPELAQAEAFDHRVDLFALGVIVYEMLAGQLPFTGNAIEIALANIGRDPPPIATFNSDVDPLLELFARKLMARRLPKRFASAADAYSVLELIETDRRSAGLALGIMDVETAMRVITLPDLPAR
jgi:serine/threonine-protein kinase